MPGVPDLHSLPHRNRAHLQNTIIPCNVGEATKTRFIPASTSYDHNLSSFIEDKFREEWGTWLQRLLSQLNWASKSPAVECRLGRPCHVTMVSMPRNPLLALGAAWNRRVEEAVGHSVVCRLGEGTFQGLSMQSSGIPQNGEISRIPCLLASLRGIARGSPLR
ncbi:hypothetical protein VTK56DRAFT_6317 [Thermocarpiscus australiensis]